MPHATCTSKCTYVLHFNLLYSNKANRFNMSNQHIYIIYNIIIIFAFFYVLLILMGKMQWFYHSNPTAQSHWHTSSCPTSLAPQLPLPRVINLLTLMRDLLISIWHMKGGRKHLHKDMDGCRHQHWAFRNDDKTEYNFEIEPIMNVGIVLAIGMQMFLSPGKRCYQYCRLLQLQVLTSNSTQTKLAQFKAT